MPWTFAHPAAVLPLRKLGLPWAALVIGSISPDIGYYLGLFGLAAWAHTSQGIVLVCLPLGAACLFVIHQVRDPVLDLLPQPHRGALQRAVQQAHPRQGWGHWLRQAVGLVLGAATHTCWDAFTHATGHAVRTFEVLRTPLFTLSSGRELQLFNLLQHLSTLLGVALLAMAYVLWLRRQPPGPAPATPAQERTRHLILAGCGMLGLAAGFTCAVLLKASSAEALAFHTALYTTDAWAMLVVAAALVRQRHPRRRP